MIELTKSILLLSVDIILIAAVIYLAIDNYILVKKLKGYTLIEDTLDNNNPPNRGSGVPDIKLK